MTQQGLQKLNQLELVKRMKQIMIDENYRPLFLDKLEEIFSSLKQKINLDKNTGDYSEMNPLDYLEQSVHNFRYMMVAAITVYFDEYIHRERKPLEIQNWDQKIQQLDQRIQTANKSKQLLKAKKNYYLSKKKLFIANKNLVSNMVQLYLEMIARNQNKRPSVDEVIASVEQMKANFFKAVGRDIEEIYLYEDDVNSDEPIPDINLTSLVGTLPTKSPVRREMKMLDQEVDLPGIFSPEKVRGGNKKVLV